MRWNWPGHAAVVELQREGGRPKDDTRPCGAAATDKQAFDGPATRGLAAKLSAYIEASSNGLRRAAHSRYASIRTSGTPDAHARRASVANFTRAALIQSVSWRHLKHNMFHSGDRGVAERARPRADESKCRTCQPVTNYCVSITASQNARHVLLHSKTAPRPACPLETG